MLVDPAVRARVAGAVRAGARHEAGWWELGPSPGADTAAALEERVRLLVAAAAVGLAIDAIRGRIRARPGDVSLATDAGGGLSEGAPARGAVSEGVRRPRTPEG